MSDKLQSKQKNIIFADVTFNTMLMKNLNIFTMLLLAFAMSALTACSDDEDFNIPIPQQMTAEYVTATLDGKGWMHVESHEIKSNGTFEKEEYWSGLVGASPSDYSFSGDSVTTYSYIDAYPISGYRKRSYTYDEGSNSLMADGKEMFKIISLNENEMKLIKYQAIDGNGKKIYVYSTYRAMSSTELAECIKDHPYDLDSLNDKYPTLPEQMRITSEYFSRYAVGRGWKCTEAHRMEMAGRYDVANIYSDNGQDMAYSCFIAADTITWMTQQGEAAATASESIRYTYRANSFQLAADADRGFRIITLNDHEMRIIRRLQGNNGEGPTELYCIYRRMTPEELKLYMAET